MKEYRPRGSVYLKTEDMETTNILKDICYGDNGFDTKTVSKEKFDKNPYGGVKMFHPKGKKDKS